MSELGFLAETMTERTYLNLSVEKNKHNNRFSARKITERMYLDLAAEEINTKVDFLPKNFL